jgi:Tol biopolymer transport system component
MGQRARLGRDRLNAPQQHHKEHHTMFASKLALRQRLCAPMAALALLALPGVSLRGGILCKLTAGSLAAMAMLLALTATPAAARPTGVNGQIVFGRDDPLVFGSHSAWTINPNGSHEQQLLPGLEFPVWSLDGSAIVANSESDPDSNTWIIDPDTGEHRALPKPDPEHLFLPCGVPSPDFERLACAGFDVTEDWPSRNGIYTVRTSDGGGLQRLTSDTYEDVPGDYSPDGKRLVYFHVGLTPPDSVGLYVLKTNGTGTRKIAPCCSPDDSGGSWSPKGNEIVFSWQPPGFQVHSTIWVVHSDGSGLRQLPVPGCGGPIADPDAQGCADATWSPDGKKILFRLTNPGRGEGGDLYTVNPDGTGLFQVTHDGDVEWPNWGTHPLATG